jgi:hypothetical protein
MKIALALGIVLIVFGGFLLYFGGIPYVKEHKAELGPFKFQTEEQEIIRVQPVVSVLVLAAGIGLAAAGAAGAKKS